jgi:hypothetical protein
MGTGPRYDHSVTHGGVTVAITERRVRLPNGCSWNWFANWGQFDSGCARKPLASA